MKGLIHGIGVNDAGYTVQVNEFISKGKYKMVWICPYYKIWRAMICRAHSPNRERMGNYKDVSVCNEWLTFSTYKKWLLDNNYKEGLAVDKDILVLGNRKYSPETCAIVPASVNNLLTCFKKDRGAYPVGVSKNGTKLMSRVHTGDGAESLYLGKFSCQYEAHKAWQRKKADIIDQRVRWWSVNFPETFNSKAAHNLTCIANVLRQEADLGIETTTLKLTLDNNK